LIIAHGKVRRYGRAGVAQTSRRAVSGITADAGAPFPHDLAEVTPLAECVDFRFAAVVVVIVHFAVVEAFGHKVTHTFWSAWVARADVLAVAATSDSAGAGVSARMTKTIPDFSLRVVPVDAGLRNLTSNLGHVCAPDHGSGRVVDPMNVVVTQDRGDVGRVGDNRTNTRGNSTRDRRIRRPAWRRSARRDGRAWKDRIGCRDEHHAGGWGHHRAGCGHHRRQAARGRGTRARRKVDVGDFGLGKSRRVYKADALRPCPSEHEQ
jgi:hypothetical protein